MTTGLRHGCNVNEQQSKLFTESLPIRRWFVPYPDSAASLFFSWYVYTAPAVQFLAWRVIAGKYSTQIRQNFRILLILIIFHLFFVACTTRQCKYHKHTFTEMSVFFSQLSMAHKSTSNQLQTSANYWNETKQRYVKFYYYSLAV